MVVKRLRIILQIGISTKQTEADAGPTLNQHCSGGSRGGGGWSPAAKYFKKSPKLAKIYQKTRLPPPFTDPGSATALGERLVFAGYVVIL